MRISVRIWWLFHVFHIAFAAGQLVKEYLRSFINISLPSAQLQWFCKFHLLLNTLRWDMDTSKLNYLGLNHRITAWHTLEHIPWFCWKINFWERHTPHIISPIFSKNWKKWLVLTFVKHCLLFLYVANYWGRKLAHPQKILSALEIVIGVTVEVLHWK